MTKVIVKASFTTRKRWEICNEGEFFNPESDKENNGVVNENNNKHESLDDIQHCIEAQRPENTTKKTNYDFNV